MEIKQVPLPHHSDPHGWTVAYRHAGGADHVHRVIGWVGDRATAQRVANIAANLWAPLIQCVPCPAPTSDPTPLTVLMKRPAFIDPDEFPDGSIIRAEGLVARGLVSLDDVAALIDDVMPAPIMFAARLMELADESGITVDNLATDEILEAMPDRIMETLMAEFPAAISHDGA